MTPQRAVGALARREAFVRDQSLEGPILDLNADQFEGWLLRAKLVSLGHHEVPRLQEPHCTPNPT